VYLRRLGLTNFRCYRQLDLTLPSGIVVVAGGNAQGKSSLLEAAYVLATTRSTHARTDRELVHWDADDEVIPYSRVWGEVAQAGEALTIEVLNVGASAEPGEDRFTKRVRVNNVPRRAFDVIGLLKVVLFTPRDLEVVDGAPAERRRYLDVLLCQIDRSYCQALSRYNQVLTQRNHLLRRLRERGGDRAELRFWDERLVADGALLLGRRLETVAALNALAAPLHADLVGGGDPFAMRYVPSVTDRSQPARQLAQADEAGDGRAAPARETIAASFADTLAARREEELARGMTVIGPHRDDLVFTVGGVDMRVFGSRGQQRTATLALKLAEARLMWTESGDRPVLLLDDVLSELDAHRRSYLLGHIDAHQQTLITTTEAEALPAEFLEEALVLEVAGAAITAARRNGRAVRPPVSGVQ